MAKTQVTVSDLSALIEAREETRAELQPLAQQAYEQWRDLKARIQQLEERLEHSYDDLSQARATAVVVTSRPATLPRR